MALRRSIDASSVLSIDDLADYDIISSDGQRSLESSIADLGHVERTAADIYEPPPSQEAREKFVTPGFSIDDIQTYVQKTIGANDISLRRMEGSDDHRTVRVYVDGIFDPFHAGHALQLRQAKLAFPLVHLMVGVHSDVACDQHGSPTTRTYLERCEVVRHCRWVDEVIPDAPWIIDEAFLKARRIDYVAIDEGTSVDPTCDKERVKGYDLVKGLHKALHTRRTVGLTHPEPKSVLSTPRIGGSRASTLRGVSHTAALENIKDVLGPALEDTHSESPFEEPKVDEFGSGEGI
ncbi:hypothetical protein C8Q75DRAFT_618955 [Abortiporus biennis]|nr:hypothetical protein C8Q75DRAFT_618955 [Abortiporus biennis]